MSLYFCETYSTLPDPVQHPGALQRELHPQHAGHDARSSGYHGRCDRKSDEKDAGAIVHLHLFQKVHIGYL